MAGIVIFIKVQVQISSHWLTGARRVLSPNRDSRPIPEDISLLLIHSISLPPGEFGGDYTSKLFCNQINLQSHPSFISLENLKVSCHLFVGRAGNINQYVPFDERAWHAGQSSFDGRSHCNDFSIGLELEGDENIPYTEIQYSLLAKVAHLLIAAYPNITPARITGHENVAAGRKTDPGQSFDWSRLHKKMRQSKM